MSDNELLREDVDGVAVLTFNRPKLMNAFSDVLRAALLAELRSIETDDAVRCVMVTGQGRAFSAGGDIPNMADLQARNDDVVIGKRIDIAAKVMALVHRLPKPVVAAINGPAAGAGMNFALGCDIRLGSTNALFSAALVKIGLIPDWGGFQALTRLVGTGKAMELMMTGERIKAEQELRESGAQPRLIQLPLRPHVVDEVGAVDQVHREEPLLAVSFQTMQPDQVRVVHIGKCAKLAFEPKQAVTRFALNIVRVCGAVPFGRNR